ITGATGLVGSATVDELINHGHKITALARSDESARKLESKGVKVIRGGLTDFETLKQAAGDSSIDGVIHLAFVHNFDEYTQVSELDVLAIKALGEPLEGTNKPFIVSSTVGGLDIKSDDGVSAESDIQKPAFPRKGENTALELSKNGVTTISMRLPPTVHAGQLDKGFIRILMNSAIKNKKAVYVEPSHWSAVHVSDAAKAYRLAFEAGLKGKSGIYHAVAEGNIPFKDIAEAIAKKTNAEAELKSVEDAAQYITFLAPIGATFKPTSSERIKAELGWKPTGLSLLDDISQHYDGTSIRDSFAN
ncbi:NAD(P)-binding protein, partial [Wallemia mellicola]